MISRVQFVMQGSEFQSIGFGAPRLHNKSTMSHMIVGGLNKACCFRTRCCYKSKYSPP